MTDEHSAADLVDAEILDCMAELVTSMIGRAEEIAQRHGVPIFFLKALHRLDCPLAMKDLGQRLHCDPSYVTSIVDTLEKRGLATRESDPADRRVKRIALTPAGLELKQRLETEILASLPWRQALGAGERACLLGHIRKIVPSAAGEPEGLGLAAAIAQHGDTGHGEEVSEVLVTAPVTGVDR